MVNVLARIFKPSSDETGDVYLIVGLGNPGREYRETRHNVGFMTIDRLATELGTTLSRVQSRALIGSANLDGHRIILAKPQTYMNLSGQAVVSLVRFYKLPLTNLIVVHDDLDLPFGTLRLRPGGGPAGQKGVASIIQSLNTQDFPRLRIGIGHPRGHMDPSDYVLQNFTREERDLLGQVLDRAATALRVFVLEGLDKAMTRFNGVVVEE